MVLAEAARRLLGQRVAVALAVRGAHEGRDDVEVPLLDVGGLPPEVGQAEVDVELQEVDAGWSLGHDGKRRTRVGRHPARLPPDTVLPWEPSVSAQRASLRANRRRRQSSCSAIAATRPARSTSSRASGWTTHGPRRSESLRVAAESRSPFTRPSPASWATSSGTRSMR